MTVRPKVGSVESLYWVMGYVSAAQGCNVNPFRNPHRPELKSQEWWQQGHDAYVPNASALPPQRSGGRQEQIVGGSNQEDKR
jgi:hypothetical protein